jgi:hypothetical protein
VSEDFERIVGLADMYGTRATIRCSIDEDGPALSLSVEAGFCGGRGYPTPEAARQVAAALLDAVERYEQSESAA